MSHNGQAKEAEAEQGPTNIAQVAVTIAMTHLRLRPREHVVVLTERHGPALRCKRRRHQHLD